MTEGPMVEVDEGVNSSGALLVSCFPSVGFVSSIVAHFLVEKLELELVGGVRHPKLPPVCLVQEGKPLPPIRFYAGEPICNMDQCDKVVLIASEIQIPSELILPLSTGLIDWIVSSGVSSTILVDSFAHGIDSSHSIFDEDEGMESMLGIGSKESSHDLLKDIGVPLLKQGLVGGMTGVMMGECRRRRIDALAILAESDGEIGQGVIPDARAAARIIGRMDGLLPAVHLDPEPLMEEAQRIEGQIRDMMAVHLNPSQDTSGAPTGMYG
ncbi:MAG: hypothetical protein CMB61_06020 [Euryarchaeota archaeon]|nr:hypothetical protein [Euryarchaeota archaeon]|tara:strand:- start:2206 stop:3009 length:804 start_codon:yes stop_codon:yes gene_type:complete